jgi:AcrR family transcriptional regulator
MTTETIKDSRERILDAALRVFGEAGYLGATTRRIAQEAGVNEVTLFRHFGSKDELIREAVRSGFGGAMPTPLPEEPLDPERELAQWALEHMRLLFMARPLIRTCMSECQKSTEFAEFVAEHPRRLTQDLTRYLVRLQELGLAEPDFDANFASTMLRGAMMNDVMMRDLMPEVFGHQLEDGAAEYAALLVRAHGAHGQGQGQGHGRAEGKAKGKGTSKTTQSVSRTSHKAGGSR